MKRKSDFLITQQDMLDSTIFKNKENEEGKIPLRKLEYVLDTPVDNFGSDFFELFLAVLFCALGKFNKMM